MSNADWRPSISSEAHAEGPQSREFEAMVVGDTTHAFAIALDVK